jgi:hypothetical protein
METTILGNAPDGGVWAEGAYTQIASPVQRENLIS